MNFDDFCSASLSGSGSHRVERLYLDDWQTLDIEWVRWFVPPGVDPATVLATAKVRANGGEWQIIAAPFRELGTLRYELDVGEVMPGVVVEC